MSDVEVTLAATDNPGGSGVAETRYSLDAGETWNTYTSPFTVTAEGTTLVLARSWDNDGNDEGPPELESVKIDRIPATTLITLQGTPGDFDWYRSEVRVYCMATDNPGGSGPDRIEYSLDGGNNWQPYTSSFIISSEGTGEVLAKSWDNAGNVEQSPASKTIKIDKTPPALTETAIPPEMDRIRKGEMADVNYSGTAEDSVSGLYTNNTVLIDEYGELDQDLGSGLSGTVPVEVWCDGNDKDGRTYIFRLTARDYAGNQASVDAIVTIWK